MWKKFCAFSVATLMILTLITGCSTHKESSLFNSGTYIGVGTGKNGEVSVEVKFSDTSIESINVDKHSETVGFAEAPIEKIPSKIIETQSLSVDVVSGSTFTSRAILEAVEDAIVQADGDVLKLKKNTQNKASSQTEEVECEVVVVGAGAAGTAAALAAVENGADVILLEKTAKPMGAGTLAGGLFAADSKQQKEQNAVVDKEWLYHQYLDISGGYMNSLLVRKIIDESGKTVDWLQENGCELNLVDAGTGGSFEHIGMPKTLHGYKEGGTVAITKLIDSFKSKGGKVYFSTPATKLHYDANGDIAGVIAKKEDGSTLKVNSKAVIIATGGYGGNKEMLEKYIGKSNTMGEVLQNTGDGIIMAWDASASKCGIDTTHYFWQTFKGEEIAAMSEIVGDDWWALSDFSKFPNLRVNLLGKRFGNETNATLYAIHGAELHMQPKETEFVIFDTSMLDIIKEKGTAGIEEQFAKWKDDPQFFMEFNEPNDAQYLNRLENTPTDYTAILDPLVGTGVVYKGETLDELAENMDIDKDDFLSSVSQYNNAIKTGKDELFFSDTNRLIEVKKGPFYAIKFSARNLGTLGGIRINENIQAVDDNGNPIKGLYVAGADAGGMYGKSYVDFEGGTLGFAYTSGRLAGENAAKYILK